MVSLKNVFSFVKKKAGKKLTNIKNRARRFKENFKENFQKAKSQPRSKRKSLLLGAATVLGIFGITLLTPIVSAVAKDLPKNTTPSSELAPISSNELVPILSPKSAPVTSKDIERGVSTLIASICGLAVTSAPFVIGAMIGVALSYAILKAAGK